MKNPIARIIATCVVFAALPLAAQITSFNHTGRLVTNSVPATGNFDLRFYLMNAATGGNVISITNSRTVAVKDGNYTVTLDFGSTVFNGANRWMQSEFRKAGTGAFSSDTRVQLRSVPHAIFALKAGSATNVLAGGVNTASIKNAAVTQSKIAPGQVVKSLNGMRDVVTLVPGTNVVFNTNGNTLKISTESESADWKLGGNSGTVAGQHFIGTKDNKALELRVKGERALRIEPTPTSSNGSNSPSIIGGSSLNHIDSGIRGSTIAGGGIQNWYTGIWFESYSNRISSDFGFIGSGIGNRISSNAMSSVIAGGSHNTVEGSSSFVGGGGNNFIGDGAYLAAISGGSGNLIETAGWYSCIGGGYLNEIFGGYSFIGCGSENTVELYAYYSAIASGYRNYVQGLASASAIGGGANNTNTGSYATIPGGRYNVAGTNAFAAGHRAKATHTGSFVWADSRNEDFASYTTNQFLMRADFVGMNRSVPITANEFFGLRAPVTNTFGGMYIETAGAGRPFYGYAMQGNQVAYHYVDASDSNKWKLSLANDTRIAVATDGNVGIGTSAPTSKLQVAGSVTATAFVTSSDRNAKENIQSVDPVQVLDKIVALPISLWNFKGDNNQHIGPMAQDFHAAFGVGADDTHIATVDADGVALAAIKGLNQKLEEQNAALKRKNAELEERLANLERLISGSK